MPTHSMGLSIQGLVQQGTNLNPLKWADSFKKWTPKYKDTFGDLTRWTAQATAGISNDAINFDEFGEDKRENGQIVTTSGKALKVSKITTTGKNAKINCAFSQQLDISNHHLLMKYYIHTGTGNTSCDSLYAIFAFFYDNAGNYAYWVDNGMSGAGIRFKPGWRTVPFRMLDYSISAGFDPTKVVSIEIWIQTYTGQEAYMPSVTFDSLQFIPKLASPVPYIFTFDGGYINHKVALQYLTSKGIKAHVYPTWDTIGIGDNSRMTIADLKAAEANGHIIGIHERTASPTGFLALTTQQKADTVSQGLAWFKANGFKGAPGFAPLGTQWWKDLDTTETMLPNFHHVRIGQVSDNILINPKIIAGYYDTETLTIANEAILRQQAINMGTIYSGIIHALSGAFTLANFYTIVDAAIADPGIQICTIPDLVKTDWYHR